MILNSCSGPGLEGKLKDRDGGSEESSWKTIILVPRR